MESIADLWQEHRTGLRNFVARRLRDRHAVDDVLQEVFLKLHANWAALKTPASLPAWLYRVASNAIADYYRAQRPTEELSDDVASPETERNYVAEVASCLPPLIADLPEKYRAALVLSEIEGRTQKDVAERLRISLSGAKSRIQRGREKLRRRLDQCCDIEVGRSGIVGYEARDRSCRCIGT